MNQKELRELIEFLIEKDVSEFELERGDVKVRIKRGGSENHSVSALHPTVIGAAEASAAPATIQQPSQRPATPAPAQPPAATEENLHVVKSPIVGTFY